MRIVAIALITLGFMQTAFAEEATAPQPCSTPEYRQLDFWVGNWEVSWTDQKGDRQTGSNVITIEKDGCVIEENFEIPGFVGNSLSMYHKPYGGWRQMWVDNQGGLFDLTGGPDEEGFQLTMIRLNEKAPHLRMIWRNIEKDSLDWHWQGSPDGGATWEDKWVLHYERKK